MSRTIQHKTKLRPGPAADPAPVHKRETIGEMQRQVAEAHRRLFGVRPWGKWNGFPVGRGKG